VLSCGPEAAVEQGATDDVFEKREKEELHSNFASLKDRKKEGVLQLRNFYS